MVFSSTIFLFVFLPITLIGYYFLPARAKNFYLLLMSILFYAYGEPKFVFVMLLCILGNYIAGRGIECVREKELWIRRSVLILTIILNLSILFYCKYYDFFISNVNAVTGLEIPLRHIVLPIGISFFTFQAMSYVFDLYLGKVQVQKNLLNLALYVALFPQLVAGPIVRYKDINKQIEERMHTVDLFAEGIKRFITGLTKKIVIANQMAVVADTIFAMNTGDLTALLTWIGAIAYMMQIYFDFSGYSDMAIGLGKMFGFTFLENFNYPYISQSITEFWRRWHISLSSWFRDYIYIPLGGSRTGNVYFNLSVVFLVTGLWHGAAWTFVLWGIWHGIFMLLERVARNKGSYFKFPSFLKRLYTILVVIIGWVLFRSTSIDLAIDYLQVMFGFSGRPIYDVYAFSLLQENGVMLILSAIFSTPVLPKLKQLFVKTEKSKLVLQGVGVIVYLVMFFIAIAFTVTSTYNPFIYFNF